MRPLRDSKGGQMPFAMIAVSLLLICSVSGIVYAGIQDTNDSTDDILDELMSVEDAINDTEKYIGSGLGVIINEISTDPDGGTLLKRIETFDERSDEWLEKAFPLTDRGTTATLVEHEIGLTVENLRISTDKLIDGTKPCYLRTTGYADVRYTTATSETVKRITVNADGTSGLPFIMDGVTKFEMSSTGDASILTELMTYQLSSLAQHRIINGYGALSQTGEKGTNSILTEKDVKESFRSSLSIVESLCFRATGDGSTELNTYEHIDAAEYLIADDGYIKIDFSQIVSQTIASVADLLIGRWLDFFLLDDAIDILDKVDDVAEHAIRLLVGAIVDKDLVSSKHYIITMMEKYGYEEYQYRYVGDWTTELAVDGGTYVIGEETVTIEPFSISIESSGIDIFSWDGWGNFLDDGVFSTRNMEERMKNILHSATTDVCKNLGTISVKADAFDDMTYSTLLSNSVDETLSDGLDMIRGSMIDLVDKNTFYDTTYIALFNKIDDNRSEIFDLTALKEKNDASIKAKIREHLGSMGMTILDGSVVDSLYDQVTASVAYAGIQSRMDRDIMSSISNLDSVLTKVPGENDNSLKILLKLALKAALSLDVVTDALAELSKDMIKDIVAYQDLNTRSGIMELDAEDSYGMMDGDGNKFVEHIRLKDDYDIVVNITQPRNNTSKCIHNIDLGELSLSPYTTVFTVAISSAVRYTVQSASSVLMALDWVDAEMSGDFKIDTKFDVACVSGWALAGVKYTNSTNFINEVYKALTSLFEPLIGPLKELFKALKQLLEMCNTALVEISTYISDIVEGFFNMIMEPLDKIREFIEDSLTSIYGAAFDIGLGYQSFSISFFGMTLTMEFRAATLTKTTKTICKVTLETEIGSTEIKAGAEVKYNEKNGIMFKGTGEVVSDDWMVKVSVDPMMKFSKKLLNVTGKIRNVEFTAAIPEVVQYDIIDYSVSDIPVVGPMLNNIPLPIPGLKGSFDMGVELKYNIPLKTGLMINEFESNPAGDDRGKEFVELYNATGETIDLTGYRIVPATNESKALELSGTIGPLDTKVFYFSGQSLKNSGKTGNHNGESLTLYDPDENILDTTPWKTDSSNDERTWQRSSDGSTTWTFIKGTPGKSNGLFIKTNSFTKTFIIDSLLEAGEDALYRMGNHLKSVDDVAEFLKMMLELFIENIIKKLADMIVSAAVFLKLEVSDMASTQHAGIRLALDMNSELVEEGLKWLISQTGLLGTYVTSPKCDNPMEIVCNDTYFRTTIYAGISTPKFLGDDNGEEIIIGISVGVNISAFMNIFGSKDMDWKVEAGIVLEDCPTQMLSKWLDKKKGEHCDLWLISMRFQKG